MSRRFSSGTRTAPAPDEQATGSRSEAGFSLVMLMAAVTLMLILMAVAIPRWKYVMKDAREEEMIFRATQITDAIERFQRDPRNGGAFPVSIEVLVKGKYLRKAYEDPMVKDGKWGIIHQGEALAIPNRGTRPPGVPPPSTTLSETPDQGRTRRERGRTPSNTAGQSLRVVNGQTHYNDWKFVLGQPLVVGKRTLRGPFPGQPPQNQQNPRPQPQ